jgi:hypothetical protein
MKLRDLESCNRPSSKPLDIAPVLNMIIVLAAKIEFGTVGSVSAT